MSKEKGEIWVDDNGQIIGRGVDWTEEDGYGGGRVIELSNGDRKSEAELGWRCQPQSTYKKQVVEE